MEYFAADHHFGHNNIIRFCKRPVIDMNSMIEMLVAKHNDKVKPEDNVYFIGDLFWRTLGFSAANDLLDRLHGNKHYVLGNHEELIESHWALQNKFVWVKERAFLHYPGIQRIVLDHYAGRVWRDSHKGSWQLFGHSHGELPYLADKLSMDVGVDCIGYAPISLDEVATLMRAKNDLIVRQNSLDVLKNEHAGLEISRRV